MVNRVRIPTFVATENLDPTSPFQATVTRDGLGRITEVVIPSYSVTITKNFTWHATLTQITAHSRTVTDNP